MDSLSLRFTSAGTSLAPPDLAAFLKRSEGDRGLLHEQLADHDDSAALGDLVAAAVLASRVQVVVDNEPGLASSPVFVTLRSAPIPAIAEAVEAVDAVNVVDARAFALKASVQGHLAWPLVRGGAGRIGRAALVMAVCIPLALPEVAQAQPATRTNAAATPTARTPAATTMTPTPTSSASSASSGTSEAVGVAGPGEPPMMREPPRIEGPRGPNLQMVLQAMRGHEGVVYTADTQVRGLILAVEGEFVVMVNAEREGRIAMIPKAQIVEVRGMSKARKGPPPSDMPDGVGALAGGGVMTGLGAPLMISGLVFVGIAPSATYLYLPQVLPALLLLGGGIPLLVIGSRRRRAYNSAVMQSLASGRLTPAVQRTPHGSWTGGLSLRF